MSKTKKALGRGIKALLADHADETVLSQSRTIMISRIKPNTLQPRLVFDQLALDQLTLSVKAQGVLMPILVRVSGDGFELIAGERRWRAAQAAGLSEIPAVTIEADDQQALEMAVIENEQRNDLSVIESARAYQRLMDDFGLTQREVSERIGRSRPQVSNYIRLLKLPEEIQDMLNHKLLDIGHVRPLIGLDKKMTIELAQHALAKSWSAREVERAVQTLQRKGSGAVFKPDPNITILTERLMQTLGLPVTVKSGRSGKGELRISYRNIDELQGILQKLGIKSL